ncbi:MAG: cyclic nucleotide-binding domain-containing protein [Planctomycetales bacterium]|nr:cyclic nucleotide-binding domain-containing protein [Planctomycetales bacterium]
MATDESQNDRPFSYDGFELFARVDDEGIFSRDDDGALIRLDKARLEDLEKRVTITIDGTPVDMPLALPTKDSYGRELRTSDGQRIPRHTTIIDAAVRAFEKMPGDRHPIPTLCHKEHLPPIGVCRVCTVAAQTRPDSDRVELVPACVQRITPNMVVHTIDSDDKKVAAKVQSACKVLVELLMADHLPESQLQAPANELAALAKRLEIKESRFAKRTVDRNPVLPADVAETARQHSILVDHNQCIMCGRCQRGCNWIKENDIIGRTGKGYSARIAFDLDEIMASSNCVQCGECAISCPTGALTFSDSYIKRLVDGVTADRPDTDARIVPVGELMEKHKLFANLPYKFLQFNAAAVVRRKLKAGEILCEQGENGSCAWIIIDGEFRIFLDDRTRVSRGRPQIRSLLGIFGRKPPKPESKPKRFAKLADVSGAVVEADKPIIRDKKDVVLGEMSCMNGTPRSATIVATRDSEVLEIKRNVLDMLRRNDSTRRILEEAYRKHSLENNLRNQPIFESLKDEEKQRAAAYLKDKVDLLRFEPNQVIVRQGDIAEDYFIVKLGAVKVSRVRGRGDQMVDYMRVGTGFGEIGILSAIGEHLNEELERSDLPKGRRTATCTAIDHVELIRIRGKDFLQLLEWFPEFRAKLNAEAEERLQLNAAELQRATPTKLIDSEFVRQGLHSAQNMLVLDLESCTRCDECTKACSDTHGGVTRLIREGMRFDKFLVASSCRSCTDPYCLIGCPVDAIHRNGVTTEIEIEDYCIGCSECEKSCPYGNISMHQHKGEKAPRATTCDLCTSIDGKYSCVYACPHEAAFRMTGQEFAAITGVSIFDEPKRD